MSKIRGILAMSAALVVSGVAVEAADLNGGGWHGRGSVKDGYAAPAPQGCPSWYARIDGGYSSYDTPSIIQANVDDWTNTKIDSNWSLGGGIGHYFSCTARGDITIEKRFDSDVRGTNGNVFSPAYGSHRFGIESTLIMASAYYDFNARGRFNPYIGLGLGAVKHSVNGGATVSGSVPPLPLNIRSNESWHVAGALMGGVTVTLRERLTLDAGYRFLYLGQAASGDFYDPAGPANAGPVKIDEIHAHEFRVGLRYDIR